MKLRSDDLRGMVQRVDSDALVPMAAAVALLAATPLVSPRMRAAFYAASGVLAAGSVMSMCLRSERCVPEYLSEYQTGEDGRVDEDSLVEGISQDSFPASDPPSYTLGRGDGSRAVHQAAL